VDGLTRTVDIGDAGTGRMRALAQRPRLGRRGRRAVIGLLLLAVAAVGVVVAANPFGGGSPSRSGNGTATSLQRMVRRSLTSQTEVAGTLGYAGTASVAVPSGTAPADVQHAQQSVSSAEAALQAAQTTLATDERTLAQAQATLAADQLRVRSDCQGDNAASGSGSSPDSSGSGSGAGSGSSPCQSAAQAVASDQQALQSAQGKLSADQGQAGSAQASATAAQQSLASAQSSATVYDPGATYTMLPEPGAVVRRGRPLYAVDGKPVLLLYGSVTAWRAFRTGMSPGTDVAALNANLRALGYGKDLAGDSFTAATEQAVTALQAARGLDRTGQLALGSVVFENGPVRVATVTPSVGGAVQTGPVLSVTSTRHEVTIQLDAAQQTEVKVGDPVTITLPDNSTTPGVVTKVGKVATVPSGDQSGGGSSTPTIEVDVGLLHEAAAGSLDQAPVSVSITTANVSNVLVVPVNALVALAGGGYAVEVVDPSGAHRLVTVSLGLFDDAEGLVEVNGSGLRAGQKVVVPGS
jgi:Putative peptidoglycan binding domain